MQYRLYSFFNLALLLAFSGILVGCATPYQQNITPSEKKLAREKAIRVSIEKDITLDQKYTNFGFGDEYIIKPPSFQPLDSLYDLRYTENKFGGISRNRAKELEDQIALVRSKVIADTILFKYEISHLFGIEDKDSIKFISATFMINAMNEVEKVSIEFFFTDHKRYARQFTEYMRQESFMYSSYTPTQEERQFYSFYEAGLSNMTTAVRKGEFISHILHVMRAALIQKSLKTELIIKQLLVSDITATVIDYKSVKWSPVFTMVDDENNLIGYYVEHEWTYKNIIGTEFHLLRRFELDIYFQVTDILEIEQVSD